MSWAQKCGELSVESVSGRSRPHRVVVDVLEFRIALFVGQSDLKAVSGSVDHRAVPDPGDPASSRAGNL